MDRGKEERRGAGRRKEMKKEGRVKGNDKEWKKGRTQEGRRKERKEGMKSGSEHCCLTVLSFMLLLNNGH